MSFPQALLIAYWNVLYAGFRYCPARWLFYCDEGVGVSIWGGRLRVEAYGLKDLGGWVGECGASAMIPAYQSV